MIIFYSFLISKDTIQNLLQIHKKIDDLNTEITQLSEIEHNLNNKINLLDDLNLSEDFVSELAQKNLGLIKQGRVLIKLNEK